MTGSSLLLGNTAHADLNSPDADGFYKRGQIMYLDINPQGTIDQMRFFESIAPDGLESQPFADEKASLLKALSLLRQGSGNAPGKLREFIDNNSRSPYLINAIAALGDWYFGHHKYAEALDSYGSITPGLVDDALDADITYRTAYCLMMLSEYDSAATAYEKLAGGGNPYSSAARFYLGYIEYHKGNYAKAYTLLTEAAKSPEIAPVADIYLAQLSYVQGNPDAALTYAMRVLQSGDANLAAEAHRLAGESLYALGRRDEAASHLWLYAAAATGDIAPTASYILGLDEFTKGEYVNAAKLMQQAVRTDDAMAQSAWLYLGQCDVRTGDEDAAAMAFDHASRMSFSPEIAETAAYNYAVTRTRGAKVPFGRSVQLFEDFLSRYPESRYAPEVRDYIVDGYMADNDYEGALKALNKMPRNAQTEQALQRVHLTLGTRLYNAADYTAALPHLRDASAGVDTELARQSLLWLGICQQALEQYGRAAASAEQYLRLSPTRDANRALALYNLAYAEFGDEKYDKALTHFKQSIQSAAADESAMSADAYCRIGDCLYYDSRFAAAAEAYAKSVSLNTASADYATFQLAMMKGLHRDYNAKVQELDLLLERYPSSPLAPEALLEKAQSLVVLKRNDEALNLYSQLHKQYPASPHARKGLLQRAITLAGMGQQESAVNDYKLVITSYPTSDEAQLAVDDLKRIYASQDRLDQFRAFLASVPQAPSPEPSEMDALTFESAERLYVNNDDTARLDEYLKAYPNGRFVPQALYYKAQAAAHSGKHDEVLELTSRLLSGWPDAEVAVDAMMLRADAEYMCGNHQSALNTYRDLEQRAGSPSKLLAARTGILECAIATGSYAEALDAADKILGSTAADDRSRRTGELRAEALQALGRHDDAVRQWRSVIKGDITDLPGAMASVNMSQALMSHGQANEAKKALNKFIDSQSPHRYWTARAFILLSDVLRDEGKEFEADEYLRSLRANYPGTESDIIEMIDQRLSH